MPRTFILLRPNLGELQIGIRAKVRAKVIENQVKCPPSPDYISGPEEPQSPPPPNFVLEPVYLEFMPLEDEILPAEEQPLLVAISPTADLPGYVPESNPEEDPEEDDDEDPEEDPTDYPTDRGDDGIDKDEPSDDDEDEEVDIKADDEEEEEHLAPTDSTTVALPATSRYIYSTIITTFPIVITTSSDNFSTTTPDTITTTNITTTTSDSLTTTTSIITIPVLSPSPPASPIRPLGYRAMMIWLRAKATSTSHSLPLPPSIILSHTRPDAPSSGIPPLHLLYEVRESSSAAARPARGLRADYGFIATMDREIRRDIERDVGYRISDSWDEIVEAIHGTQVVTVMAEFSQRMTEFETRVRHDTDEIYKRLDDEQLKRQLDSWSAQHALLGYEVNIQVMSLRTQVVAQQAVITELHATDRRRQAVITEMLAADHMRQKHFIEALKLLKRLQT
ncbi:hypothetical protein Tco_1234966 [Tanacetum coccineum]